MFKRRVGELAKRPLIVPADATVGVGRADDPEQATAKDLSVYEKQIQINKNLYH